MCVCVFPLSIHNAVISVFQRKELGENELYTLNEGVRSASPFVSLCFIFIFYFQTLTCPIVVLELVCILGSDLITVFSVLNFLPSLAVALDFRQTPLLPYKHNGSFSTLNLVLTETLTHVR